MSKQRPATRRVAEPSPSQLIDGEDQGAERLAGRDAGARADPDQEADPEAVEEWKWRGVPVWSHGGILFTGETYKTVVKLTFAEGAALDDPEGLFNSSLDGNTRRAIDIHEGERIDEGALKALIRAAVARNIFSPSPPPRPLPEVGWSMTALPPKHAPSSSSAKSLTRRKRSGARSRSRI